MRTKSINTDEIAAYLELSLTNQQMVPNLATYTYVIKLHLRSCYIEAGKIHWMIDKPRNISEMCIE